MEAVFEPPIAVEGSWRCLRLLSDSAAKVPPSVVLIDAVKSQLQRLEVPSLLKIRNR